MFGQSLAKAISCLTLMSFATATSAFDFSLGLSPFIGSTSSSHGGDTKSGSGVNVEAQMEAWSNEWMSLRPGIQYTHQQSYTRLNRNGETGDGEGNGETEVLNAKHQMLAASATAVFSGIRALPKRVTPFLQASLGLGRSVLQQTLNEEGAYIERNFEGLQGQLARLSVGTEVAISKKLSLRPSLMWQRYRYDAGGQADSSYAELRTEEGLSLVGADEAMNLTGNESEQDIGTITESTWALELGLSCSL